MAPHALKLSPSIEKSKVNEMTEPSYLTNGKDDLELTYDFMILFKENNIAKIINVAQTLLGDNVSQQVQVGAIL